MNPERTEDESDIAHTDKPALPSDQQPGISRAWDVFMLVALVVAVFYIVSFIVRYPKYWYAGVLFLIIGITGIVRRVAIFRGWRPNRDGR